MNWGNSILTASLKNEHGQLPLIRLLAMIQDDFKRLKVRDGAAHPLRERVTHPAFIGFLTVAHIETSFDYSVSPPKQYTDASTIDTGHRLKACGEQSRTIIDERNVGLLKKIIQALSSPQLADLKSVDLSLAIFLESVRQLYAIKLSGI